MKYSWISNKILRHYHSIELRNIGGFLELLIQFRSAFTSLEHSTVVHLCDCKVTPVSHTNCTAVDYRMERGGSVGCSSNT